MRITTNVAKQKPHMLWRRGKWHMTMPLTSAKANHDFPWLRGARWVRELNDKHRR